MFSQPRRSWMRARSRSAGDCASAAWVRPRIKTAARATCLRMGNLRPFMLKKKPRGPKPAGHSCYPITRCSGRLEEELHSEAGGDRRLERVVHQEARILDDALFRDQLRERLLTRVEQIFVRNDAIRLLVGRELRDRGVLVEQVQDIQAQL